MSCNSTRTSVRLMGPHGSGRLRDDLFGVLSLEFSEGPDGSWNAASYGGTQYSLSEDGGSFLLEWELTPDAPLHDDERRSMGEHAELAAWLSRALGLLGWSVIPAE